LVEERLDATPEVARTKWNAVPVTLASLVVSIVLLNPLGMPIVTRRCSSPS